MATKTFNEVFGHLIAHGMTPDELYDAVCKQVNFRPQECRHALFMLECMLPLGHSFLAAKSWDNCMTA